MLEDLAARLGIGLLRPEEQEVVQDASGGVDVGRGPWREAVELGEPSQDLVADRLGGAVVGDEVDDLRFDAVGGRWRRRSWTRLSAVSFAAVSRALVAGRLRDRGDVLVCAVRLEVEPSIEADVLERNTELVEE